ncbi:MAG: hypothetical protein IKP58_01395 [Victivallales bacterium]|nr:hypothetical protein [Victivallales bacterium]
MPYTVLMMDIPKSRQYQQNERQELQDFCLKAIDLLNRVFIKDLVKVVEFSAGDEMQGLFGQAYAAFLYLRLLRMMMWDRTLYAGLGYGDWTVRVDGRGTVVQDGRVYHLAREALEICKKTRDYSVVFRTDTEGETMASAAANSLFSVNERMNQYQNDLWFLLEMFWPVYDQGWVDEGKKRELLQLLKYKQSLSVYNGRKKDSQSVFCKDRADDILKCRVQKYFKIDALTAGHPYGAVTKLAEVTGLRQQSIDNALAKGNIFVERNTAFAMAAFLHKELKGEKV